MQTSGGSSKSEHAAYMRDWRKRHPKYKASQRDNLRRFRLLHPDYDRDYRRNSLSWKAKHRDQAKRDREKYPDRRRARLAARIVPIGDKCEICGATEHLERHHPDYSKPKFVVTRCSKHNREVKKNGE